MECETCREALSARLDDEAEPVPAAEVDEHLRGCAGCRDWQRRAVAQTRLLRVRPAVQTPDLTGRILAAAPAPPKTGWGWRVALGVVAIAQLTLGLAQVLGVDTGMRAPAPVAGDMNAHLFDESTAWNLALGLGMAWVALRTRAAAGMLPVFLGFLAVLAGFSVHDLAVGDVPVSRIASHGLLVVGFAVMCVVWRTNGRHGDPRPGRSRPAEPHATEDTGRIGEPGHRRPGRRGRPPLRPANRRTAA